jgi:hypothetical protein
MTGETGWGSVRFDWAGSDDALSAAAQSAERETWHGEIWSQAKLPEAPMRRASGASQCCRAVDCDLGIGRNAGAGRAPTLPAGHQTGWPQSEPHVVEWLSCIDLTNEAARWRGTK